MTSWLAHLDALGIRVLRNERVEIGDTAKIDLAGIEDAGAHRFGRGQGAKTSGIIHGRDVDREMVLLAHQPKAVATGAGLQISGHTHGGRIFPFAAVVRLVQSYVSGLHAHDANTKIYVSRGTGYWGPPMRLLAPSEITKFVLTTG